MAFDLNLDSLNGHIIKKIDTDLGEVRITTDKGEYIMNIIYYPDGTVSDVFFIGGEYKDD